MGVGKVPSVMSDSLQTVARQAHLAMELSRQEYWSGWLCPPPGDLPNSRIEPTSLVSPALANRFFTTHATWEALSNTTGVLKRRGELDGVAPMEKFMPLPAKEYQKLPENQK